MMSEKRFIVIEEGVEREDTVIEDTITKERYNEYGVVELLNEQQATINKLKEENKELEDEHDDFSNFLIDKGLEFEFEKWCKDE